MAENDRERRTAMIKSIKVNLDRPGLWMDGGVAYGQADFWYGHVSQNLKLDVIYPHENQEKPWPCIVWICGGAWRNMDVHAHMPNFVELARKGFVVASVQYRLSNEVTFPAALEDVKAAIRYLRRRADRYNIDVNKFGVMGESAGGHLAGMVAVTGGIKEFDKGDNLEFSSAVQAACPWYMVSDLSVFPPLDEPGLSPEARFIGGIPRDNPDLVRAASPVTYVSSDCPPCLLLHGTDDNTVPHDQSVRFYDALEKVGVPVTLVSVEGADHADENFFQEPVMEIIGEFFEEILK